MRRKRDRRPYRSLPLRKSLLGRFLGVFALVAACSVAATAWLAVQTTSGAIRQEQGQNLADDARIYDALLGYGATHTKWDGAEETVRDLARRYGRRVAVTTQERRTVADSATGQAPPALAAKPSAVVDPLAVDTVLGSGTATDRGTTPDRIDPRAVGPFRLTAAERTELRQKADRNADCLRSFGTPAEVVENPAGRPRVVVKGGGSEAVQPAKCPNTGLDTPTRTEEKALAALNNLADACLSRQRRPGITLHVDLTWQQGPAPKAEGQGDDDQAVTACVSTARREQLGGYVAPPALLFIGTPDSGTVPGFDLSPANTARIVGVAALVLALTIGVALITGRRLVRPLHALTGAAHRMKDSPGAEPVPVTADDELGQLAVAFNEMAEHRARLEELRKAMVSDVAHELRTPLSNIRGWLEAAQDGLADPGPEFTSSLLEEAVQLQHIIDDLQDLAEADAGALRLHPEEVRLDALLAQVAAAHQARADTAGVALSVTTQDARLTADPVRLRQAIDNLISNAIRHTPSGGEVALNGRVSGEHVVVEVRDTGIGIPAADLPHVFDRFWRAEKSRSRRTGGSGLGLAIVRKLAEAHGGSVSAVSTEGKGSVFTLRLPAPALLPGQGADDPDAMPTAT